MRGRRHRKQWLLALALGCESPARPPEPWSDTTSTVTTPAWAGCEDYVDGGCLLLPGEEATRLRFWVDVQPATPLEVTADGASIEVAAVGAGGGTRAEVVVPHGTRELQVTGAGVGGSLRLLWHEAHPTLSRARKAMAARDRNTACPALASVPTDAPPIDQALARFFFAQGCGDAADHGETAKRYGDVADFAATNRLRRTAVLAAHAALHTELERRADLERARSWLPRVAEFAEGVPELEMFEVYSRALLSRRDGQSSTALDLVAKMSVLAERLGFENHYLWANEARATFLAELGRAKEARQLSNELLDEVAHHDNACDRARIINNATWTQQMLADAGLDHDPPLVHMLEEAEIYESGECEKPASRIHARINVASAALSVGDLELAQEWLDLIEADDRTTANAELAAQIDYLALGIALETNRWGTVEFPLLVARPAVHGDARMRWRATVREAQVLERFGLAHAAVDAWRRAEALLDEDAAAVGVSGGRESFVSGRTTSAIGLVEALLRQGDTEQAFCRARIARGRALRRAVRDRGGSTPEDLATFEKFLAAREELERDAAEDWAYAGDELEHRRARREEQRREAMSLIASAFSDEAPPDSDCAGLTRRADGEILLLVMPTRTDTIVFVAAETTTVRRMPAIPEDETAARAWADDLLREIAPTLAGAERVRVLPVGRAWGVPIHAATYEGRAFIERVATTYGLDLPAAPALARDETRVLVVADPTGDLPNAKTEAQRVSDALRPRQWELEVLEGPQATRDDVLARLPKADLFHYSGHGEHRGADGWDGAMLLDGHKSIEVADILALPRAPQTVVLAGCDTGAVNAGLFDGGMSLGRAFLLAGSDAVVVGDRKVDDAVTATFAAALYDGDPERLFVAPELAVRDALRKTAATGVPVAAWSGFRLIVR